MTREEAIKELSVQYLGDSDRMREAKDMAISALSENKGEWIPVSERLPEKEKERYLIDYEHEGEEYITVSYYDKYGFWSSSEVKAWQPLPEPYKGESK